MISAKVICDSSFQDSRLITIQTRAPKYLDSEVCKHRMLSANSSSDRAIPFTTMIKREPFIPFDVRYNQKGMQGDENISSKELDLFQKDLEDIYSKTVDTLLKHTNIHKQHLNRYLLGFSMQDKVITGNEDQFRYFIKLRKSKYADPTMQELAACIESAINNSDPEELHYEQWHTPYVTEETKDAPKLSVARCARVSYLNHDQSEPDKNKDIILHDSLLDKLHLSCFEHVAKPMINKYSKDILSVENGVTHIDKECRKWSGNFHGWIQYRQLVSKWN